MRRTVFIVLFAFSLSMNLAVGATVVWHLWHTKPSEAPLDLSISALNRDDVKQISDVLPRQRRIEMMKIRRKIQEKKLEVLELIARNPGNLNAAEQKIDELVQLRGQLEKQALTRISEVMVNLPPERRSAFLGFLRNRACMGHGMGYGMGRRMMRGMGPGMGRGHGMRRGACPPRQETAR